MPPLGAADAAEIAGDLAIHEVLGEGKINLRSPSSSGRCAMAVYHSVFNAGGALDEALYWADWWSNDGGDLESVPDGTPPDA
jgi:hypothetical protein